MVDGDGRAWSIRDPERFYARFRVVNQVYNIAELSKDGATQADIDQYVKENPSEGAKLTKLQMLNKINVGSGLVSLAASSAIFYRWTRGPILAAIGGMFGAFAGQLVMDDVASLALGTFKFDNHKTLEDFYTWVNNRKANELPEN